MPFHTATRIFDRRNDVDVRTAAADVPTHEFPDVVIRGRLTLPDQGDGRADLTRRTVSTLEGIMVDERLLHRVEGITGGEAFYCGDLRAIFHDGESHAGQHSFSVDQDGAGPALAVIAPFPGSWQVEVFAEKIDQHRPWLNIHLPALAVYVQRDGRRSACFHSQHVCHLLQHFAPVAPDHCMRRIGLIVRLESLSSIA
jgi:hypothetical protein